MDYKELGKRQEKVRQRRGQTEIEQEQQIGIWYPHIIDERCYTVASWFPVGTDAEIVQEKFNYLIDGQKR